MGSFIPGCPDPDGRCAHGELLEKCGEGCLAKLVARYNRQYGPGAFERHMAAQLERLREAAVGLGVDISPGASRWTQ